MFNNSTNINITDNDILPQIIVHKKHHDEKWRWKYIRWRWTATTMGVF
jgi:hypothetical protein